MFCRSNAAGKVWMWPVVLLGSLLASVMQLSAQEMSTSQPSTASASSSARVEELGWTAPATDAKENLNFAYSGDALHYATVVKVDGGKSCVELDGKRQADSYDIVGAPSLNHDGTHLAYYARKNGKGYAVVDGKAYGPYDDFVKPQPLDPYNVRFNRDGSHFYFAAKKNDAFHLVVDGKDFVCTGMIAGMTPDRGSVLAAVYDGKTTKVIINGKTVGQHDCQLNNVGLLQVSEDGSHFVYGVSPGGNWNRSVVIRDGQEEATGPIKQIYASGDWKRLAYFQGEKRGRMVVDGKQGALCTEAKSFTFSKDSKRYAYIMAEKQAVIDGEPGDKYYQVGRIQFGDNGIPWYWASKESGEAVCVVDGKVEAIVKDFMRKQSLTGRQLDMTEIMPGTEFLRMYFAKVDGDKTEVGVNGKKTLYDSANFNSIGYSADGKHYGFYSTLGADDMVVVDGKSTKLPVGASVRVAPFIGPCASHWLCIMRNDPNKGGKNDNLFMLHNGQPGAEYVSISEQNVWFSEDGAHWAYGANNGKGWLLVLDGKPGPEFDSIYAPRVHFEKNGRINYLALRGGKMYRVEQAP